MLYLLLLLVLVASWLARTISASPAQLVFLFANLPAFLWFCSARHCNLKSSACSWSFLALFFLADSDCSYYLLIRGVCLARAIIRIDDTLRLHLTLVSAPLISSLHTLSII